MSDPLARSASSDGELLFRLSRGDEPAYRLLHDRHQAAVFHVALLLLRSTRDAEEVAATAFFELWRKRDKVRVVDGSVLPWLIAAASRTAKNGVRSRRRYRGLLKRIPHAGEVTDHPDEAASAMDALNVSHHVRSALLQLSARDASVVVLCVVQGLSTADAAVVLGASEGTVKARLSRARARLHATPDRHLPRAEEASA
ncbi:RNA polymerase sigma factor [Microbacterium sp. Bi121]|uniref:RNA polymerase sigma factor n=1 Tax=Microbacterium sp. Bi121 TaxID=2822348 RepID=UPI001E467A81|nr:RNA polymerase sigma factor [Microbacterium sp. Bi121]